ncbi:hypothetical protein SEA_SETTECANDELA_195 [Mycobacterium phage Settecandela]|nr:hypothetical protein SEA_SETTECANDELA_195 [Mycobacterium phage Settecandela]
MSLTASVPDDDPDRSPGQLGVAEYFYAECRHADKRAFHTRLAARLGAKKIREGVEAHGGVYGTLYPYSCPDDSSHWHLTHRRQGYAMCPVCCTRAAAWFGGRVWIIAKHEQCRGVGHTAVPGTDSDDE